MPVKVRVVEFGDRPHFQLQWTCPTTGKKKTKSSGIERTGKKKARADAEREAGDLERKLEAGESAHPERVLWGTFRDRYEREVSANLAHATFRKCCTAFDILERIIAPKYAADVTSQAISRFLSEAQTKDRGAVTVGIYGRLLRAAFNWGKQVGLIQHAPKFRLPGQQRGDSMAKARAICGEEHDRIKLAIAKTIRPEHLPAWERFLDGLWWSGLRLGEALALSWDSAADVTAIIVPGKRPVVRFRAAGQKARRDELWPCPPEFAAMLEAVPEDQRTGRIFQLHKPRLSPLHVCELISKIGTDAGVLVNEETGKHATAHDYRRAFGTRWAKRVMPVTLKRLMRHADISTTLKYYVSLDAEKIADELWQQFPAEKGNTSGNTSPKTAVNSAEMA